MIVWLCLGLDEGSVLALEHVVHAVGDELVPAADVHGEEKDGLAGSGGEVKSDAIEVDKLDVKGCGSAEWVGERMAHGVWGMGLLECFLREGGLNDVIVRLQGLQRANGGKTWRRHASRRIMAM